MRTAGGGGWRHQWETMVSKQLIPSSSTAKRALSCDLRACGSFPCSAGAALRSFAADHALLIHSCAFPASREMSAAELKIDIEKRKSMAVAAAEIED